MKRPKFLFLDAVRTLMDMEPDFLGFFTAMAESEGVSPDPQVLHHAIEKAFQKDRDRQPGRTDYSINQERERAFWRAVDSEIFRAIGFGDRAGEITDKAFEAFETGRFFRLYDDAIPALERIRAMGLPIAVVSNGTEGMNRWLDRSALAAHVEFVMVSAVVGWEKPGPEIFREACRRAGVAPGEALFAGDSYEHDVAGAKGAGMPCVWIAPNSRGEADPGCPVLSHIGELPGFLETLTP